MGWYKPQNCIMPKAAELTPTAIRQAQCSGLRQACPAGQAQLLAGGPVEDSSSLQQEEWVSASKHTLPDRWMQKDPQWDFQHIEKAIFHHELGFHRSTVPVPTVSS